METMKTSITVLTLSTLFLAFGPDAAAEPPGRGGPIAARDRSHAGGAPSPAALAPRTRKPGTPKPPRPSADAEEPAEAAPPPRPKVFSPCLVDGENAQCDALFRWGTWAVLAANNGSLPGVKLALRICERFAKDLPTAERDLQARVGAAETTTQDAPYKGAVPARLPEALYGYKAWCEALVGGGMPEDLPASTKLAVVMAPQGRVTLSGALQNARAVAPPAPASPPRPVTEASAKKN
jgi:hypothetical protein